MRRGDAPCRGEAAGEVTRKFECAATARAARLFRRGLEGGATSLKQVRSALESHSTRIRSNTEASVTRLGSARELPSFDAMRV